MSEKLEQREEYNEAKRRVRVAHKIIAAQLNQLERAWHSLRTLETVAIGNPMFRHTALNLTQATEHVARAKDAMNADYISEQLALYICRHCGRKKPEDKPYCSDDCERCAKAPQPVGMPCAMICVSNLAGE